MTISFFALYGEHIASLNALHAQSNWVQRGGFRDSLVTRPTSGRDDCSVARGSGLGPTVLHIASPHGCVSARCCQSRANPFWVQSSTERQHACSGHGDHSHCLNCQQRQSTGILRNEKPTNNDHNFQASYGNLSGRHMKAFCFFA